MPPRPEQWQRYQQAPLQSEETDSNQNEINLTMPAEDTVTFTARLATTDEPNHNHNVYSNDVIQATVRRVQESLQEQVRSSFSSTHSNAPNQRTTEAEPQRYTAQVRVGDTTLQQGIAIDQSAFAELITPVQADLFSSLGIAANQIQTGRIVATDHTQMNYMPWTVSSGTTRITWPPQQSNRFKVLSAQEYAHTNFAKNKTRRLKPKEKIGLHALNDLFIVP